MPSPTRRSRAAYAAAGLAGLALLAGLLLAPGGKGLAVGEPAPELRLTDLSGRTATLADYRGRVVLLDFWATWCLSCEQEVPELKALHGRFSGRGLTILGASVDQGAPGAVARFASEHELPYPVLFAQPDALRAYRVFGLPAKFLIDPKGLIAAKYPPDTPIDRVAADVRSLLEGRRPS